LKSTEGPGPTRRPALAGDMPSVSVSPPDSLHRPWGCHQPQWLCAIFCPRT